MSGPDPDAVRLPKLTPNRTLGRSVVSLSQAFISIKFTETLPPTAVGYKEASEMKKTVLALATAATIGVSALVAPSPAQAWRGGWGGGLAGGLICGGGGGGNRARGS